MFWVYVLIHFVWIFTYRLNLKIWISIERKCLFRVPLTPIQAIKRFIKEAQLSKRRQFRERNVFQSCAWFYVHKMANDFLLVVFMWYGINFPLSLSDFFLSFPWILARKWNAAFLRILRYRKFHSRIIAWYLKFLECNSVQRKGDRIVQYLFNDLSLVVVFAQPWHFHGG